MTASAKSPVPTNQALPLGSTVSGAEPPKKIGRYVVERVLGEGGMGKVYACRDPSLDRQVAVKVLLDDVAKDPDMSARFRREAQAMAKLSSPQVITVFEVGDDEGVPFIAMEMLDGEDVGGLLEKKGALPLEKATRFTLDAVAGLSAAYDAGIVHRDVKPANLFLADEGCKLADFGLARPVDGSADLTSAGIVVGSPHYLAPEVARGGPATLQSDVYSLGATFYEMLTGRTPFSGNTPLEVISAHLTQEAPAAQAGAIGDVVKRMLAKEPSERYASYADLRNALEGALSSENTEPSKKVSHVETQLLQASMPEKGDPTTLLAAQLSDASPDSQEQTTHTGATWGAVTSEVKANRSRVKTENLTIMFTDIVGYTQTTSSQTREEAAAWLKLHDDLLRPVIKAFAGKVIKTIGDALLVTFKSPTDGVLCGTAIQDHLYDHNATCGAAEKLQVRVALSTGEVRLESGDVFGEPVNIAARLESVAEPGEVLFSDATYATMNNAELPVEPRGSRTLKGIQRDVQLFAALPAGEPNEPPFRRIALARIDLSESLLEAAQKGVVDAAVNFASLASTKKDASLLGKGGSRNAAALAALIGFLVVLLVGGGVFYSVVTSMFKPADLALIDEGKSLEVIRRIEKVANPSAKQNLILGHAYFAEERDRSAADAYHDAFVDGETDERAKENLIKLFGSPAEQDAQDALARWPRDDLDDEMVKLSKSASWAVRHAAYGVLKKRKKRSLVDEEALGLLDIVEGSSCAGRHFGLKLLKRVGKSQAAVEAVRDAGKRLPDNLCLMLDVNSAERAIQGRME